MDDEYGFTMVDETFGVREASDASESDEVQSVRTADSTPASPVQHGLRSDSRNSLDGLSCEWKETAVSDALLSAPSYDKRVGRLAYRKVDGEEPQLSGIPASKNLAPPSRHLNSHKSPEQVAAVLAHDDHGAGLSSGTNTNVMAGKRFPEETHATWAYPSRASPFSLMLPRDIPRQQGSETTDIPPPEVSTPGVEETLPLEGHDTKERVHVAPASPRGMIREAATTAVTTGSSGRVLYPAVSPMKALRLRVLPGEIMVGTVVPWTGEGSVSSVADLEREMQRQLGLRQRVRLGDVQVEGAGEAGDSLVEAPDGGTIRVHPLDALVVRARLRDGRSGGAGLAQSRASPHATDRFVALPLGCSWSEAEQTVKAELGVDARRRGELRRVDASGHELVGSAVAGAAPGGRCLDGLRNGDTVLLVMAPPVPAVTRSSSVHDSPTGTSRRSDPVVGGVVSPPSLPAPEGNGLRASGGRTAAEASGEPSLSPSSSSPSTRLPRLSPSRDIATAAVAFGTRGHTGGAGSSDKAQQGAETEDHPGSGAVSIPAPTTTGRAVRHAPEPASLLIAGLSEECALPAGGLWGPAAAPPLVTDQDSMFAFSPAPPAPPSGPAQVAAATATAAATVGTATGEEDPDVTELIAMGFDRDHVVAALRICGPGDSRREAAISLLLEPRVSNQGAAAPMDPERGRTGDDGSSNRGRSSPPSLPTCPICFSVIPASEEFTVDCSEQHVFCLQCLGQHCTVQLLDASLIPACPMSDTSCGHELSQDEVERVFLLSSYSSSPAGGGDGGWRSRETSSREERALEACRTLLTRRGLAATGAIPCVSSSCGNWMVPVEAGLRVRCGSCLIEFCRRCKRSPYHYAAECEEVVTLAREWEHWLTEGKTAFLEAVAAQDEDHMALLQQHRQRRREHDRAVQEAERLRKEYDAMEDWKERRCRLCPGCGRTIEKLSGCDLMKCGTDAHGGNEQRGCGERFVWSAAPRYVGDRGVRKEMPFTEAEPRAASRAKHFIAPGIELRCDRCHRAVVGPLFRCIHCPSFACCLECQDAVSSDPRHVHHTFRIAGKGGGGKGSGGGADEAGGNAGSEGMGPDGSSAAVHRLV